MKVPGFSIFSDIRNFIRLKNSSILTSSPSAPENMIAMGSSLNSDFGFEMRMAHSAFERGDFAEALRHFQFASRIEPKNPDAHCGMAQAFEGLGNNHEAERHLIKAEKYNANDPAIKIAFGTLLLNVGKFSAAIKKYDQSIELLTQAGNDNRIDLLLKVAIFNSAVAYRQINEIENAIGLYRRYIELFGSNEDVLLNLGNAYDALGDFEKAKEIYHDLMKSYPSFSGAKLNYAEALNALGRIDDAESVFREILDQDENNHQASFGLGLILLKKRNWNEGWRHYKSRWKYPKFVSSQEKITQDQCRYFREPVEKAEIKNKNILVFGEQGIGDTIMFCSYLKKISKENSVQLVCDKRLTRLIQNSFQNITCISFEKYSVEEHNLFDYIMPIGDLPLITERSDSPFLFPTSDSIDKSMNIGRGAKKLIGISWRGGLVTTRTRQRSMELSLLTNVLKNNKYQFVNIQHGEIRNELNFIAQELGIEVITPKAEEINEIDSLAALIKSLDVVLTVQNTNVHISGAIGKKCIVMLPSTPEWRYGLREKTMPWYKDVKLLRQDQKDNWMPVIDRASDELELILRGEH